MEISETAINDLLEATSTLVGNSMSIVTFYIALTVVLYLARELKRFFPKAYNR